LSLSPDLLTAKKKLHQKIKNTFIHFSCCYARAFESQLIEAIKKDTTTGHSFCFWLCSKFYCSFFYECLEVIKSNWQLKLFPVGPKWMLRMLTYFAEHFQRISNKFYFFFGLTHKKESKRHTNTLIGIKFYFLVCHSLRTEDAKGFSLKRRKLIVKNRGASA
jgi:hypothetical protein